MLELLQTDGAPIVGIALPDLPQGDTSPPWAFDVWYQRGQPGGDPLPDLLLGLGLEDPQNPGRGLTSGLPPLDELWAEMRWIGQDAAADPTQVPLVTDWTPVGAGSLLAAPAIHAGCSRRAELRWRVPGTAAVVPYTAMLLPYYSEHARALREPSVSPGIVTQVGEPASGLWPLRGGTLAPSTPPDGTLTATARQVLDAGQLRGEVAEPHSFDALDGNGVVASDGERYALLVTQAPSTDGGGTRAYRGPKAAGTPEALAVPAGEVELGRGVAVVQSGAVVLDAADLTGGPTYGWYQATSDGADLVVHAGQARGGGTRRLWTRSLRLTPPSDATSWLWQGADGLYAFTATPARPGPTWLGPWWQVTTAGGAISDLIDLRTWATPSTVLTLEGVVPAAPGPVATLVVPVRGLQLESVVCTLSDHAGATAGATVFDLTLAPLGGSAATLYPGSALDDQRPTFAAAGPLLHARGIPEVCALPHLATLTLELVQLATGAAPQRGRCDLVCQGA